MKAKVLIISVLTSLSFAFSGSLSAQGDNMIYNDEFNSDGQKVAVTYYDNSSSVLVPSKKNTFEYNSDGNVNSKTTYVWDVYTNEWTLSAKTDYVYDESGSLRNVAVSKWDGKKKSWKLQNEQKMTFNQSSDKTDLLTNK